MLYFDEYGNKENPTILLLHGAGALDTFCKQYCFSEKYHLIVPHLPGAGKSADKAYKPDAVKRELWELIDSLHKKKIGLIGHSLGGQLAVMLVCERPDQFNFAVFLSTWLNPKPQSIRRYCSFAKIAVKMLHTKWLVRLQGRYWNYSQEQSDYMADYSRRITPQIYKSFFTNTLDLRKIPTYSSIKLPMLAICGSKEQKDMKISLHMLGKNTCCQTMILPKARHFFPMRNSKQLNAVLNDFLLDKQMSNQVVIS